MSGGPMAIREAGNSVRLAVLWTILGLAATGGWGFLFSRYVNALEKADTQAVETNKRQDEVSGGLQAQISSIREIESARDAVNQAHRVDVVRRLDRIEVAIERLRR